MGPAMAGRIKSLRLFIKVALPGTLIFMTSRLITAIASLLLLAGFVGIGWQLFHNSINQTIVATESPSPTPGNIILEQLRGIGEIITPPPLRGNLEGPVATLTAHGVFSATNRQRAINSVPEVKRNTTLDQAAASKAQDMFAQQYFDHVSPQGKGPADVVDAVHYEYIRVGENLALGNFASDEALVEAWMNSPGHRANILSSGFTEIGIAVQKGTYEGRETWMAVQTFGTPLSACPMPIVSLRQRVEDNKLTLDGLQQELADKDADLALQTQNARDLVEEIETLATGGNKKIEEGNAEIQQGNELYQETGSREQAELHWNRGQTLQAEGQAMLDEAKAKQGQLTTLQNNIKKLQDAYNETVEEYNILSGATVSAADQYNTQVNAFNGCLDTFK